MSTLQLKPKKYTNVKTGDCPSFKHHMRKIVLQSLEKHGEIQNLQREIPFSLDINNIHICTYIADFVYIKNGKKIIEDVKGRISTEYNLKKKLMLAIHNIEILET